MRKTLLIIITTLVCVAAGPPTNTNTKPIKEAAEREYWISTAGGALTIWPVGASFDGEKLVLFAVTVYFPERGRLISVNHGKTDHSYLVTMETRGYSDETYIETFTLNLQRKGFLEFASDFLSKRYVPSREKKPVTLEENFHIYWESQPREKLAKAG